MRPNLNSVHDQDLLMYGRDRNGVINQQNTTRFMQYWDAGCRYILSIISESEGWEENVDVWGVPHLINNALGGWLIN